MSYATYAYYSTEYGGKLTEQEFDTFASRASDYIDYMTMGKAAVYDDADDALKKCCCALSDEMCSYEATASTAAIASETVGSHSRSYRSAAELRADYRKRLDELLSMYLLWTGLLYRGVPCIRRIP